MQIRIYTEKQKPQIMPVRLTSAHTRYATGAKQGRSEKAFLADRHYSYFKQSHTQITQNTTSASMSTLHKQHTKVDYHKLDPSMLMQNLIAKLGIASQAQDSCFLCERLAIGENRGERLLLGKQCGL